MSTSDTETRRFEQWLGQQTGRDGPLGELARHTQEFGIKPDLVNRCRNHYRDAHRETHLDQALPVLGMRQAWEEWSAENLLQLKQHWPAVIAKLSQADNRPRMTWLPGTKDFAFPDGRKIRVEADGETMVLRFQNHDDHAAWRGDDVASLVEAALREVFGRSVKVETTV